MLDGITIINMQGEILHINAATTRQLGYSREEAIGKMPAEIFIAEKDKPKFYESLKRLHSGNPIKSIEFTGKHKDGTEFPAIVNLSVIKDSDGNPDRVVAVHTDITDRKLMEKKLESLSITDELTGLNNRRGFSTFAERLLKLAKRENKGLFMLYGDLDDLKGINDTLGHKEGDNALIDFANILKATYRETDIIARISGDEFAVVPVGTTGDCVEKITARLQEKIVTYNATNDRRYNLSVSVGIAYFDPESPCSIYELLAEGDKMMYEQKMRKKNS
jgi:diguanylate cyclase (GGDEF)-like protein/PAS domain S-box-containing protein